MYELYANLSPTGNTRRKFTHATKNIESRTGAQGVKTNRNNFSFFPLHIPFPNSRLKRCSVFTLQISISMLPMKSKVRRKTFVSNRLKALGKSIQLKYRDLWLQIRLQYDGKICLHVDFQVY